MLCNNNPQNAYFDYGCYYELKDYFDKIKITDSGEDLLKKYQEPKTANREIFKSKKKLFSELVTRLAGNNHFYHLGTAICCKYINYWLHDRILSEFTDLDGSHFIVFKDFVREYFKFRGITFKYKEKCEDFIQPLFGSKKYTRMRMLYQIYSSYKEIKEFYKKNPYDSRICDNLALIIKNYNDLLREHKGDLYLNNRLQFFKDLLLSENKGYNTLCTINLENSLPKPVIPKSHLNYYTTLIPMLQGKFSSNIEMPVKLPPKVQHPTAQHTVHHTVHPPVETFTKQQEILTEKPQQQAKLVEATEREETEEIKVKKELEEILGEDMQEKLGKEIVVTIKKQLEEELTQRSVDQPQEQVAEQLREGDVDVQEGLLEDRADNFNRHDSSYMHLPPYTDRSTWQESLTRNRQSESLNDKEGFFGNVKSTFSSIAEHVEPAPILGVSGGMGVLFLLFKYTPVGTMFRGRGIRRRIPGSFGGEYSGFIPSFQGYEDGYYPNDRINISYGLE